MSTQDKIKQLPDGYRLFLSNTNGAFTRDSEIDTDDLKALVSELEAKTRALEHYANRENWSSAEENGVMDWYDARDMPASANGYDIATAALFYPSDSMYVYYTPTHWL